MGKWARKKARKMAGMSEARRAPAIRGKRKKVTVNDYRSSNYSDSHRTVTLVDGKQHRERVAYARKPGNGKRQLLTPEAMGDHLSGSHSGTLNGNHAHVSEFLPVSSENHEDALPDTVVVTRNGKELTLRYGSPEYVGCARVTSEHESYGGSDSFSIERDDIPVSRPEIPIEDVPYEYSATERHITRREETYNLYGTRVGSEEVTRLETVVKDRPKPGYTVGALVGRKSDKRNIPDVPKSHKHTIGKRMSVPNR